MIFSENFSSSVECCTKKEKTKNIGGVKYNHTDFFFSPINVILMIDCSIYIRKNAKVIAEDDIKKHFNYGSKTKL